MRDPQTTAVSTQLTEGYRKYPVDDHGKLRFSYAKFVAAEALAADSTIGMIWLPPGRKRILPDLSFVTNTAFGAGRTVDIGHEAYVNAHIPARDVEPDDPDAFVDGLDVAAAAAATAFGTDLLFDMYSKNEVLLYATVLGGTMPVAAELEVRVAYLYE